MDRFGELAAGLDLAATRALTEPRPFRDMGAEKEWRQRVAEELLLAHSCGGGLAPEVLAAFGGETPFDAPSPRLKDLVGFEGAVAVLPLANSPAQAPALAHLWCMTMPEAAPPGHCMRWEGMANWRNQHAQCAFYGVAAKDQLISGRSWQLAAALAARSRRGPAATRLALAGRWIVTGAVGHNDTLAAVTLGNKLSLPSRRTWLIPAENATDVPQGLELPGGLRYAATLEAAWNQVSGGGSVDGGHIPWPDGIRELHSFVSAAREPVLAAALLTRPERLALWHTDDALSQGPLEDIVRILGVLLPNTRICRERIASNSMTQAESRLREVLQPSLDRGLPVLFNVTQGNRLMSFAAHTIARLNPALRLIYRDIDAPPLSFTMIHYEGFQPTTVRIEGQRNGAPIRWEVLFAHRPPAARKPWEDLLREIAIGPEHPTGEPASSSP